MELCECGGHYIYLETLKLANLNNPFKEGSVAKAIDYPKEELFDMIKN